MDPNLVASGAISSDSVSAVAHLGQDVLRAVASLAKIFGKVPEDLVGVIGGDTLHHHRLRNLATLAAKTDAYLQLIDQARRSEVSLSVAIPLIAAAVDESRRELQDLWAALLANAQLDDGVRVRTIYFDILKGMEPIDAKVLELVSDTPRWATREIDPPLGRLRKAARADNIPETELGISLYTLSKAGLIYFPDGAAQIFVQPLGQGLLTACKIA